MRRRFPLAVALSAAGMAFALGGCAASTPRTAEITVSEVAGPFAPLTISVDGLLGGSTVNFSARAKLGPAEYASAAEFVADEDGTLDLADDAPVSSDWATADAMGPFWSMTGPSYTTWDAWDEPYIVDLVVSDDAGRELASLAITRPGLAPGVQTRSVDQHGIKGVYAIPADMSDPGGAPAPAVLVFTGSDGGLENAAMTARWIAGLGFPALGISYFGTVGQPTTLEGVPVETFETGLAWLREQPEVDVEQVSTFGISRGGEMALWLAAEHPDLIAGAVAPVGAGAIVCGYPKGIAWTRAGAPLLEQCSMSTVGSSATQIDVAAIDGPIVLACGTDDPLWDSCAALDDIVQRRTSQSLATPATRGEGALHAVSWAPDLPGWFGDDVTPGQIAATRAAQRAFWSDVEAVLADQQTPERVAVRAE